MPFVFFLGGGALRLSARKREETGTEGREEGGALPLAQAQRIEGGLKVAVGAKGIDETENVGMLALIVQLLSGQPGGGGGVERGSELAASAEGCPQRRREGGP